MDGVGTGPVMDLSGPVTEVTAVAVCGLLLIAAGIVRAIGGHGPLHLTSTGKLFLAADEPEAVRAYASRTGLKIFMPIY